MSAVFSQTQVSEPIHFERIGGLFMRHFAIFPTAAFCLLGFALGAASANELTWGSMTVNSGPTVYDWMLQDWIDDYFEDGSKGNGTVSSNIVTYQTQCFGGDFLENFNSTTGDTAGGGAFDNVGFTNATTYSANEAGKVSYYDGYHRGAANAMAQGTNSGTVHTAGVNNKYSKENPQSQGAAKTLGGTTSTHVLIWAGKPEYRDYLDLKNIQDGFPTSATTTVTTLAGNGNSPYTNVQVDGAATLDGLKGALQSIGALMDDGADEQFALFVTDHGNIEKINTTGVVSYEWPECVVPISLGSDVLEAMYIDDFNIPTVEFFTPLGIDPFLFEVEFNGALLGTLADAYYDPFEYPISVQNHFTFELEDEFLLDGEVDTVAVRYLGELLEFPVTFDILLGSGDIARVGVVPEPATLMLFLVGLVGLLRVRRRR